MKKIVKYLYTIIPLIIVAFLGYKYIKNPDVFLQKKDVDKAKKKIKDAKQLNLESKDLRQKINKEVMKVQAKSNVRFSELNVSSDNVEELEKISSSIEKAQDARKLVVGDLLKKKNDG